MRDGVDHGSKTNSRDRRYPRNLIRTLLPAVRCSHFATRFTATGQFKSIYGTGKTGRFFSRASETCPVAGSAKREATSGLQAAAPLLVIFPC
jgi:hypothetical protein